MYLRKKRGADQVYGFVSSSVMVSLSKCNLIRFLSELRISCLGCHTKHADASKGGNIGKHRHLKGTPRVYHIKRDPEYSGWCFK